MAGRRRWRRQPWIPLLTRPVRSRSDLTSISSNGRPKSYYTQRKAVTAQRSSAWEADQQSVWLMLSSLSHASTGLRLGRDESVDRYLAEAFVSPNVDDVTWSRQRSVRVPSSMRHAETVGLRGGSRRRWCSRSAHDRRLPRGVRRLRGATGDGSRQWPLLHHRRRSSGCGQLHEPRVGVCRPSREPARTRRCVTVRGS